MSEHIITDLQVMADTENKIDEIARKLSSIEAEYNTVRECCSDVWGNKAKEKYFLKSAETSDKLSTLSETLKKDKDIIRQARLNYENAENSSGRIIDNLPADNPFSTKKMFL